MNKQGTCLPHSILGTVDEYLKEAAAQGHLVEIPPMLEDSDVLDADFYIKPEFKFKSRNLENDNGENALNNWRRKMLERKLIQSSVSSNDLIFSVNAMNCSILI